MRLLLALALVLMASPAKAEDNWHTISPWPWPCITGSDGNTSCFAGPSPRDGMIDCGKDMPSCFAKYNLRNGLAVYEADEPITIRCNGKDDGANWTMAEAIAVTFKTRVKIGPNCLVKPDGKLAGMITSSIVIDGTTP